jgi:uncharacterized protein with NRDE domain
MCLLGIDFGRFEECPVLVLANREEFYARPATVPSFFPAVGKNPGWVGGVDLVAAGTWLGVNQHGLLVAVTNRKKRVPPVNPPSRGLLCRKLLAGGETARVVDAALRELDDNRFAGCNLLIANRDNASVVEAGDTLKITRLSPGLHLLANADLNDPLDERIERVRHEFSLANPATADNWIQAAKHVCQLSGQGDMPPICLTGSDRGTVSSTVLGLGRPLETSRYWFAPGPPNSTKYDEYTPLLRQLFGMHIAQAVPDDARGIDPLPDIEPPADSPARRAIRHSLTYGTGELQVPEPAVESPYRILLRGPWQSEALDPTDLAHAQFDGAEPNGQWALESSTTQRPRAATVRLPASWQELFGSFRGRVRFRRKFHPPSNLTATDRLAIVFDGVAGAGTVSLNGRPLGLIAADARTARFDETGLLRSNNELQVDLEFGGSIAGASPGGLFAPVALEIDAAR